MASLTDTDFDTELLISEIQNRPVLWDQNQREYSDRNKKKQAWEEICNLLIKDFEAKTNKENNEAAVRLQKKWKGIRDAYVKNKNKKLKSGSGASTSKEYIYSHLLSFLDPTTRSRPSKTPPPAPDDENTTNVDDDSIKVTKKTKKSNTDAEDKLIQTLIKRMDDRYQNKDISGKNEVEYNFALSLVDDLRAIHPDYKMDAKIEIMNVLKKYKHMSNNPPNYYGYFNTPELPLNVRSTNQSSYTSPSILDEDNTEDSIIADLF